MRVSLLTTWGDTVCGIRDYSEHLVRALEGLVRVEVVPLDPERLRDDDPSPYFRELGRALNGADLAHLQHEYSFFGWGFLPPAAGRPALLRPYWNYFFALRDEVQVPVVMTVHEVQQGEPAVRRRNLLLRALQVRRQRRFHREVFRSAARCIVHSRAQQELLAPKGVERRRIVVIPHGVPPPEEGADEGAPAVAGPGVLIGMIGFLGRRKGYLLALDALSGLPEAFRMVLIGGRHPRDAEGQYEEILARVRGLGLEGRVEVTGYLPPREMRARIRGCALVLAPQMEGFTSGSLALALSLGKPVVASDLDTNREIVERVPCLRLFRTGDAADLRRAVRDVAEDPTMAQTLSRAAREYAARYAYERVAERTVRLYAEVLAEAAGGDRGGAR